MAYRGADPTDVMGRRIGAYLIDAVIFGVIAALILVPALPTANRVPSGTTSCQQLEVEGRTTGRFCSDNGVTVSYVPKSAFSHYIRLIWIVQILEWIGAYVLLQGIVGASPGKLLLGLRVVKPNGELAGLGRCFVRTLILPVDAFCCALPGLISSFNSKGHRRLGDMAGDTLVIGRDDQQALMLARSGAALPDRKTLAAQQYAEDHRPTGPTWEDQIQIPGAPSLPDNQPVWDEARQAYLWYDPQTGAWSQWDDATNT